ncbi:MAG: Uma2 family endonuclease [Gemmatimonadaceae bacterium]
MGMPATTPIRWTAEMVRALPSDRNRYEVVGGELYVTPSPPLPHQYAAGELYHLLRLYLSDHPVAQVVIAPSDVEFDRQNMVQPDVFALPLVEGRRPISVEEAGSLLLAVEVLSPSSARSDRNSKRKLYQRFRVPDYWIVDLDARVVERWRPDDERPEILIDAVDWQPDLAHPAFVVDLAAFFQRICGDK